ncbi:uncharacterized protein C7orf50 homolog isoform X1 [Falco cherrug]|uniref:uncharacterized protein C7orf50 homolog isoform X1 n=1 Tax=Falco cherrug TaxID=345164 RepID=UPI002478786A|nr:uncharacterized protein C7orf50 homolog isoform X1 [Falco cherrug]XP_055565250.1 uncharacterized protein C7orf50 homolog isoform X1 [Falco cherrug]XP_055565251.1 uncharacterized protein C7orf50 homolog isoform X1 [Falco cherrug]
MPKMNVRKKEKKAEKRKKLKQPVAQKEELELESEPKEKKQNLQIVHLFGNLIFCKAMSEISAQTDHLHLLQDSKWLDLCSSSILELLRFQAAKEEEELTAEERRKLERKLKKERKKKEKQLMREAGISTKKVQPKKPSGSELALAYLTSWSEKPEEWKFQKTRQTWLLLHMYDKEKVPDKYFTILLDYLQGLQGSARDITVQKAEAFMKEFDGSNAEDPDLLEKCERIRQVLQLLS